MQDHQRQLGVILEKLNFSTRERQVYLALLAQGSITLRELAQRAKIKKPTVDRVLKDLIEKGLIMASEGKYKRRFSVFPPQRILTYAGRLRRRARRLELEMQELLPQLQDLYHSETATPRFEVYNNPDGYIYLSEESLECREKIIRYLGNLDNLIMVGTQEYDHNVYIPKRIERGIRFQLLTHKTLLTQEYQKHDGQTLRETRFLNPRFRLTNSMMIFDENVIFFSDPQEMLALRISSPSLAVMQKQIYTYFWTQLSSR